MSRILKSKYKIDRRLKCNLWGRPKSPFNRRDYPPGLNGQNRKKKPSDFGIQLMAKQKLKCHYGYITEKQFRNLFFKASKFKGNTSENLIELLERNLVSTEWSVLCTGEYEYFDRIHRCWDENGHGKIKSPTCCGADMDCKG